MHCYRSRRETPARKIHLAGGQSATKLNPKLRLGGPLSGPRSGRQSGSFETGLRLLKH